MAYSAIILDKDSQQRLKNTFKTLIPAGWNFEMYSHHMTLLLTSKIDPDLIGKTVSISGINYGIDDRALALKIDGYPRLDDFPPHITIAINREIGAKPSDSNFIQDWSGRLNQPIKLNGTIRIAVDMNNKISQLPFAADVLASGGKIYEVGGSVRDQYLGKQSKDLDIVIAKIPVKELTAILEKYGSISLVGESFGVIKFKEFGKTEDVDIALPRKETMDATQKGHKAFDVQADPFLDISVDQGRRDFTFNSIARDENGEIYDPYNGVADMQRKVVRAVNPDVFADDPLRMIRAIQFAARFNFTIEPNTLSLIKQNAYRIKEISGERVLLELEKISSKGNHAVGAKELVETGIFKNYFGFDFAGDMAKFNFTRTLAEFIFFLFAGQNAADIYKNVLKGDYETSRQIKALSLLENANGKNIVNVRINVYNALQTSTTVLRTSKGLFEKPIYAEIGKFRTKMYLNHPKDLAVNGHDLMAAGLKGTEIGEAMKGMIQMILMDKLQNKKEDLVSYAINREEKR